MWYSRGVQGRQRRGCGDHDRHGVARPDQHAPILINGEPLALNEFGLQVLKTIVIQVELALERSIRQTPSALQEGNRLIEEFLKGHRCPSTGCEASRIQVWEYGYLLSLFVLQRAGKGKQEVRNASKGVSLF